MLKVGLHVHTTISDGREKPRKMIKQYKKEGFDAVILSDHRMEEKVHDYPDVEGITTINGCEVSKHEHYIYTKAGDTDLKWKAHPTGTTTVSPKSKSGT